MENWFDNVISPHLKQDQLETAAETKRRMDSSSLINLALGYRRTSGIYDVIAQYFRDLKDPGTAQKVEIRALSAALDYDTVDPNNDFNDYPSIYSYKDPGYHINSEGNDVEVILCAGNKFSTDIKLPSNKILCHIIVTVHFCRDEEFNLVTIIKITFKREESSIEDKTSSIKDPTKEKLNDWLKNRTTDYIGGLSVTSRPVPS